MHLEIAQHLPASALHEEAVELLRVLSRFRWRLGFERTLRFGLRGAIASGLTLIGVSVISWAVGVQNAWWPAALPLLAALALGLARWPSHAQAALAADRRLALEERLGTAVELARRRPGGRFDALQVRDAVARARSTPGGWLTLDRHFRREAWLAAGVVVLAAASLLLARLPAPQRSFVDETGGAAADAVPSVDLTQRELPPGAEDIPLASAQPVPQTKADAGLAARVQQEQSERTALDNLSQALGSVSAGQPAANAIQQGDFGSARSELQNLGDEADQLSDAAKQQLGKALQDAAAASAQADRQLADKERQAAQSLSRATYGEQRQALRGLGDQVQRSGSRSVSADQLARDIGQLQQQSPAQGAGARSQTSGAGQQGTTGTGSQAAQQQGPAGGQGSGAAGQQGGPGVGTGTDPNMLGDQPSRLDTAGQSVQVPTKLNGGPGVRPPDGTEDQVGADPAVGGRNVSELVQAQQTGQVAPEQNLVPGEQRPVVRGYFR